MNLTKRIEKDKDKLSEDVLKCLDSISQWCVGHNQYYSLCVAYCSSKDYCSLKGRDDECFGKKYFFESQ